MNTSTSLPKFYPFWLIQNYDFFEPQLKKWFNNRVKGYDDDFSKLFNNSLFPGRRTRPLLLLEIQKRLIKANSKIVTASISIELLHRSAIILDDYLDAENVRRGINTFHSDFGLEATILFPHILIAIANEEFIKLNPNNSQHSEWLLALQDIALAEYSDLVKRPGITIEDQFHTSVKRTQLFFQMIGLYIWTLNGKKNDSLNMALAIFGRFFQISNDIFDMFYLSDNSRYNTTQDRIVNLSFPVLKLVQEKAMDEVNLFKAMPYKYFIELQKKAWKFWGDEKYLLETEGNSTLNKIHLLKLPKSVTEMFIELINLCSQKEYWLHPY